ncbi:MAG: 3-keto-5-aminohexanoate cleavage protein [Solirubrobacterales bacterium]
MGGQPGDALIINAAITGMVPMPERVPHVPVTPDQIVADAERCVGAGASILHLHARGGDGRPTWRREPYEEFVPAIRERCPEAVVCVTTSGRSVPDPEKRSAVLGLRGDARPDMASLTLGSLNFRHEASINPPELIERLAARMRENNIKPELEIFDTGMAQLAETLLERDLLERPLYANLLLGGPNTAPARPRDLVHLVESLPPDTVWAAGGFGRSQLTVNGLAAFMGGHVRTGLEDNPLYDWKLRTPATNSALVERVVRLADLAGRTVSTAQMTRRTLGVATAQPAGSP